MNFLGVFRDTVKDFFVTGTLTVKRLVVTDTSDITVGAINATSLKLSGAGATTLASLGKFTIDITPASVAAGSISQQVFSAPGVRAWDFVSVSPLEITPGVIPVSARSSADDLIYILFCNPTASAATPSSGPYVIWLAR